MTATLAWFLAAARTMAGPPMSICSTHSSGGGAAATVCSNGYRLDTSSSNGAMPQLGELLAVRGLPQVGEQPGVHRRVQGLDPAVEALGEPGQLLDPGHRHARGGDRRRGAAGGHDLDPGRGSACASPASPVLS